MVKGWVAAMVTMRLGETVQVAISPAYGYDCCGMLPVIPCSVDLVVEIKIVRVDGGRRKRGRGYGAAERARLQPGHCARVERY